MISNRQRMLIQIYRRAAGLDEPSYRNLLREFAGVESSTDRAFSQPGFDQTLAALERVLFDRVTSGQVPDPRPSRYISSEFYWRHRLPADGFISTRQAHRIDELWAALQDRLDTDQRSMAYLRGMIAKATGKPVAQVGLSPLTSFQAAAVIEALQDRLAYATQDAPCPF